MAASRGRKTKSVVQRLQLFPRIVTAPRRRWLEIVGGHFAIIVLDEGGWRRSDVTSKISSDFPTTVVWLASVTRRIWCRLEASQSQSWRAWPRPRPPLHAGGYHIVVRRHRVRVHKLR